uniref:Uncharacterized protein n=1 Tax=Oryza glumipatula TaxID=40148 RepID=A0A0D9YH38_9ORYZ
MPRWCRLSCGLPGSRRRARWCGLPGGELRDAVRRVVCGDRVWDTGAIWKSGASNKGPIEAGDGLESGLCPGSKASERRERVLLRHLYIVPLRLWLAVTDYQIYAGAGHGNFGACWVFGLSPDKTLSPPPDQG